MLPRRRFAAAIAVVTLLLATGGRPDAAVDEGQIGAQVYEQLAQKGEIVDSSPWYAVLNEVGRKISGVANEKYQYPFHFILVREQQPNAFSVPGGNVYVTLPLMTFVKNKEELAGVLCHETSHDIHHDVVHLAQKEQTTGLIATGLAILLGRNSGLIQNAIGIVAQLQDLHFSRNVEENADHLGAETCARAGYDPWGMVWLFQQFEKADTGGSMEMLSDHPTDQHRIAALEQEFRSEPYLFARYTSSMAYAHPMPTYSTLASRYGNEGPFGAARRPGY
ncbi:MAG: M48 family metalloprotease [Candidatus Eremiobacteraeota bacterium]|nr:M48 family metalloprotease [Candidatus Eremiobacteraeota bacterium]